MIVSSTRISCMRCDYHKNCASLVALISTKYTHMMFPPDHRGFQLQLALDTTLLISHTVSYKSITCTSNVVYDQQHLVKSCRSWESRKLRVPSLVAHITPRCTARAAKRGERGHIG